MVAVDIEKVSQPEPIGSNAAFMSVNGRFEHIDAMRAFAVLLVVIAHTNIGGIPGGSGVTIFFVISGFVITHLLIRERERTGGFNMPSFYIKRLLKLGPPFVLIILIPTGLFALLGGNINWLATGTQVFFLFNWAQYLPIGELAILPGSSVVWSLAIEEQFYIIFAIFWALAARHRHYLRTLIAVAISAIVFSLALRVCFHIAGIGSARIYSGTDTRIDAIGWGVLAAALYSLMLRNELRGMRRILSAWWIPMITVVFYLASLIFRDEVFRDTARFSVQALAAALLIVYGLLSPMTRLRMVLGKFASFRPIQIIGLASYSMYLVHAPLYRLLAQPLEGFSSLPRTVILIASGIFSGIILWWLIERPIEIAKRKRRAPSIKSRARH